MQYKKKYINDRLLEAGLKEFLDKGYRQGSITTVAEDAGVPIGNLYRYFDGKSGLLDALVKSTYQEIPKLIEQLAWVDADTSISLEDLMVHLAQLLLNLFDAHGKEMVLLVDKCASTRYEDFFQKVIDQVSNLVFIKFYGADGKEIDKQMAYLASKAFIGTMFDILRSNMDREKTEKIILRVMNFYFYELDVRK